jgi:hypothetical protein
MFPTFITAPLRPRAVCSMVPSNSSSSLKPQKENHSSSAPPPNQTLPTHAVQAAGEEWAGAEAQMDNDDDALSAYASDPDGEEERGGDLPRDPCVCSLCWSSRCGSFSNPNHTPPSPPPPPPSPRPREPCRPPRILTVEEWVVEHAPTIDQQLCAPSAEVQLAGARALQGLLTHGAPRNCSWAVRALVASGVVDTLVQTMEGAGEAMVGLGDGGRGGL